MKKTLSVLMVLMLVLSLVACTQPVDQGNGDDEEPGVEIPGKIAIITNTVSQNEEEYRSAEFMMDKYGEDVIVHELWPDNFMTEQEQMISVLSKLAADEDVKAIIINQAVPGTNPAVDKFLEVRDKDEVLIIYSSPQENPPDVASRADIVLQTNDKGMGVSIPTQAKAQGAEVFVHYTFPRHMAVPMLSERRDIFKEICEELGIEFVDATAPDPTSEAGVTGAQQFILEDVPKKVDQYGKNTAFFATNCSMQVPLITAVIEEGAIYPQPCCPSPYHGFPSALGLDVPDDIVGGLQDVIDQTTEIIVEKGMGGRLSTWPVPAAMMSTIASTEYAVKWMLGETEGKVDKAVLQQCMADYAKMEIELSNYEDDGEPIENYFLFLIDFLTYGDLPE